MHTAAEKSALLYFADLFCFPGFRQALSDSEDIFLLGHCVSWQKKDGESSLGLLH